MVGLSDANIFGSGNKLKFMTNFSRKDFSYGGNMVEYEIPNLLGTFYTAEIGGGRDFYNSTLNMGLRKEFLKPTDYEIGLTYSDIKAKRYMIEQDTSLLVKERNLDVWGGYSHYLRGIKSSVYLSGRYNYRRVSRRPLVAPDYNPALHDQDALLVGGGLYREKILHGQHDLRIRYARVSRDGLQGRSDDGLFVGRIQRRPLPRRELRNGWIPRTGLHHGRLHARKLHRPRKRHVAAQRRRCRPAVVLQPFPVQAQPHPPVPRLQLHAGLEPCDGQRREHPLHAHRRPASPQGVHHRNQPHDPQHRDGGIHPPTSRWDSASPSSGSPTSG